MVVAADHVGDLHQRVVNHHHVVVNRHPTGAQNDGIADHFVRELDIAVHNVVKADGMLGNAQPNGAGLARAPPPFGFFRIDGAALAGINRRSMLGHCPLAFFLQVFFGAETQVGFAFVQQAFGVFAVDRQPVGLAIRTVRSANIGAFVPIEAQPFQIADELVFEASFAALDVGILDAQHHDSALGWRANSQLNSAVRALPTWRWPVGDGAKRTRIWVLKSHE